MELRGELNDDAAELLESRKKDGFPNAKDLSPVGLRELIDQTVRELNSKHDKPSVHEILRYELRRDSSERGIPVRVYVPEESKQVPALVWCHGGGWVAGSLESADFICRHIATKTPCSVVSIDYRLAPENPFPAGILDCYSVVQRLRNNPAIARSDGRLAIGGVSSGGNLAAATTLYAKFNGDPPMDFQMLGVPILKNSLNTNSYSENAEGYGLERSDMEYYWNTYLDSPIDGFNTLASPLLCNDLTKLPPTMVLTAGFDPLRDEGIAFAERLEESGIEVDHLHYNDMPHGILGYSYIARENSRSLEAITEIAEYCRERFSTER